MKDIYKLSNNMRCIAFVVLMSLAFNIHCIAQSGVANPVGDFLAERSVKPDDKLLKLETDLNHDGKKQIFLSLRHDTNGHAGNIWTAYLPKSDGTYLKVEETDAGNAIQFRPESYFVGKIAGIRGDVLATYFHGGGGKGTFIGYQLRNNAIHELVIKQDFEPNGEDKKTFKKTVGSNSTSAVQQIDIPKQ